MFGLWLLGFRGRITVALCCLIGSGCGDGQPPQSADTPVDPITTHENIAAIKTFCAHCHAFPDPRSFARKAWKAEVAQGYRLFDDSPTQGIEIPPEDVTVRWFEAMAPEVVAVPTETGEVESDRFQSVAENDTDFANATAISCIRFDHESQRLWGCDMSNGSILSAQRGGPLMAAARPLELVNPCRVTPADLDGDGVQELLVSDLGSFFPNDHKKGAVWAFAPENDWAARPILNSVARVSDVQPADFDGDGDIDLVVAEFGWRRTGRIVLLWNEGEEQWREEVVDKRHGAIDVPIVDLNADGRPDFVTVLAQEHETVVAYINQGNGTFRTMSLYEAGDPSFGSSGIQIVDFDRDGDFDILHTNGDSFDDGHIKPFHGIRWLENTGENSFQVHELTAMPGVHRALAADVDLDGDNDVVAVSLLPPNSALTAPGVVSILWLEKTADRGFLRHIVETEQANHASCELVDWDSDGDLDLCVTHFRWTEERGPAISWFRNQTINSDEN